MLNVAYIGCGRAVTEYHLPYLVNRPNFNVKWIYRRQEDRDENMEVEGVYPEFKFTSDIEDLTNDNDLHLVVICSPNPSHKDYAVQFLNSGKHVLVEKPFTLNVEDTKEVLALAKEKGLIAMSNQNRRYDGDMRTVKKIIDSGILGDIVDIESHYNYFRPNAPSNGIGFFAGLTIHPLDQIIYLFGTPDKMDYDVRSINGPGQADDYVDLFLYYGKTKVRVKTFLYSKLKYPRFIVHGSKGSFLKPAKPNQSSMKHELPFIVDFLPEPEEYWGTLSYIDDDGNDITEKVETEITDYGILYDNLYEAIHNGAKKLISDEEIIEVMSMVVKGQKVALSAK